MMDCKRCHLPEDECTCHRWTTPPWRLICIIVVAGISIGGCTPIGDFAPKPNQEVVVQRVWRDVFNAQQQPPPIGWRDAECGHPTKWFDGWHADLNGFIDEGECKQGFLNPYQYYVNVLWQGAIYRTALVHELWHARLLMRDGDGDPDHRDPGFQDGGIVETTGRMLIDERL